MMSSSRKSLRSFNKHIVLTLALTGTVITLPHWFLLNSEKPRRITLTDLTYVLSINFGRYDTFLNPRHLRSGHQVTLSGLTSKGIVVSMSSCTSDSDDGVT